MADKKEGFTFQIEQFPNGVYGVPLVLGAGDDQGVTIGSALVTFMDGQYTSMLQITDAGAELLGLKLKFQELAYPLRGSSTRMLVTPHPDIDFVNELKKRWG